MKPALISLTLALLLPVVTTAQESPAPASDDTSATAVPGVAGGHGKAAVIAAYDANGDGTLTLEEYTQVRKTRFDAADADKDGALNEAEYVAEFEGRLNQQYADQNKQPDERYENSMKQAAVRHAIVDRNRDGLLSWDEQQLVAGATFDRLDSNKDGVIDATDPEPEREDRDDTAGDTGGAAAQPAN